MEVLQPPRPTGYEGAQELVDKLSAAGIFATCDPRSATPPCVLVTPPVSDLQRGMCEQYCTFDLYVLAPATANADTFRMLEWLSYWVRKALPSIEAQYPSQYNLSADSAPLPAYRLPIQMGV